METYHTSERIIIWFALCLITSESVKLSVGTYNLWNVMFNWNVRLRRVADMIREHNLDVVVFQEVRLTKCELNIGIKHQNCYSQLDELAIQLPEYKWIMAHPAGKVSKLKGSFHDEWEFEGLGIISRKQVMSVKSVNLKQTSFRDENKRIAVHVKVQPEPTKNDIVDVVVVHFSYDPQQQCDNANDVIKLIDDSSLKHSIILGDFNVYGETSPAFSQFVGAPSSLSMCENIGKSSHQVVGRFQDAWLSAGNTHVQGLTFSNMPTPGPQSRPDRIVVTKNINVTEVGLVGKGTNYKDHYNLAVTYNRAWVVFLSAYHSFVGLDGYPCLHDCGPRGHCRCGVCVKGGDHNNCHLPNCSQCSGGKFVIFVLLSCLLFFMLIILLLSVIRILVVSARFNQNDIMDILGYRCCLFNRQLFQLKVVPRRCKIRLVSILRLFNLPPLLVAIATLALLCVILLVIYFIFGDSITVVLSVLPEEKFPSDHRMVFARLNL